MRVRTCCIDEIALAFNALTNHSPGLAATRQHHIKNITEKKESRVTQANTVYLEKAKFILAFIDPPETFLINTVYCV